MWPLMVPVGRGGASGKALAVGAAPRAGGAEGVLQPAFGPQGAITLDAHSDQGCRPSRPLPDVIGLNAKSAPHARRLLSIRPDQFFTYFLMSFWSSEAAKVAPLPCSKTPLQPRCVGRATRRLDRSCAITEQGSNEPPAGVPTHPLS